MCRTKFGESRRHKQLRSIGYETLQDARTGVEYACHLAVVESKLLRDALGNATSRDYSYGIVGCADIYYGDERRYNAFGATFAMDMSGDLCYDVVDTTIVAHQFEHASCEHSDDDEFAHTHNAVTHRVKPVEHAHATTNYADDACEYYTYSEHEQHVESGNGCSKNGYIWYYAQDVDGMRGCSGAHMHTYEGIDTKNNEGCGSGDEEVHLELVAHAAPLRTGGSNCGVGYKREVVAEESSTHHNGGEQGC